MEKTLLRAATILLLGGLLTGAFVSTAMTGVLALDERSALAAHLNALLGSFVLFGLGASLPNLRYGARGRRRVVWLLITACYANWLVTAAKAALHVKGLAWTGQPANDAVFAALLALVVLPSLAGTAGWVAGLF